MRAMRIMLGIAVAVTAASAWVWAAQQRTSEGRGLAADLPPGALLTIESPDFSKLLADWNSSHEQAAWMHSVSYNVFTNSRLSGRLSDAEQEFAGAAGSDFGSPFLKSVAGTQSIFAWYNIGNLELLYITHLKPGQGDGIALLASRSRFTARKAGDTTFYVRGGNAASEDSGSNEQQRTVAFAQRGEWLLISTREDLIANALLLMQGTTKAASLADQGWYEAAAKAAPAQRGDLRMVLDLDRITHTPQFESYWVQRNVTETRRYHAAEVDLYREAGQFREERVLLPAQGAAAEPENEDTSALAELVPQDAAVYRAAAGPSVAQVIAELRDKVLERTATPQEQDTYAPVADLSVAQAGDTTDLETRIDTPQPVKETPDAWLDPLQRELNGAPITAMLSVSAATAKPDALFLPIHAAVVLKRTGTWDEAALAAAVLRAASSRLTVGGVGVSWAKQAVDGGTLLVASGASPMAMVVRGDTAVIGTDDTLVREIAARMGKVAGRHAAATVIAEFRHPQTRPAFVQLTSTLDRAVGTHVGGAATASDDSSSDDTSQENVPPQGNVPPPIDSDPASHEPAFFSGTVNSLSRSFASLSEERFLERHDEDRLHQTVIYVWETPKPAAAAH